MRSARSRFRHQPRAAKPAIRTQVGVATLTRVIRLTNSWSAQAISSPTPLRLPLPTNRVKNITRFSCMVVSVWAKLTSSRPIGHRLSTSDPARKIIFAPAELFMNDLIFSLRHDGMSGFKERMRQVDVLILDDVHFLAGRERTQEEFFHTFNALHGQRHQIVLTSDKAPRDLTGLEERLRNRFESGLIADISPPDLETRVAILQKKAAAEKLALSGDVTLFVAQRASSNVRELEGCFNRLAALASLNKNVITLDFARESLRDLIREEEPKLDIDIIQQHVAESFHIRLIDLKSKKRTQHLAFCRQVAMYLCRKLTSSSFPAIGAGFGRDHSTVIHACNLIAGRVDNDGAFRVLIQKIERQLQSLPSDAPYQQPRKTQISSELVAQQHQI